MTDVEIVIEAIPTVFVFGCLAIVLGVLLTWLRHPEPQEQPETQYSAIDEAVLVVEMYLHRLEMSEL